MSIDSFLMKKIHPGKLTCPLERDYFNRKYIFQPSIFRGHVSFGECIWGTLTVNHQWSPRVPWGCPNRWPFPPKQSRCAPGRMHHYQLHGHRRWCLGSYQKGWLWKKSNSNLHREETCGVQFNGPYFFVGKIWKTSHLMHLVWWFWRIFFTNYKAWEVWKNSRLGAFPR